MKFQWFGASHFLVTTETGVKVAMDPFQYNIIVDGPEPPPGGNVIRPTYTGEADVVTMSHGHFDHSYICAIGGVPRLYTGGADQTYRGVQFSSTTTYHGENRGLNNVITIEAEGIRACHVGDHGHVLTDRQVAEIGRVDILMTNWDNDPVEMTFEVLEKVLAQLKPRVVFPMHHVVVDDFMTKRKGFMKMDVSEVTFTADTLPDEMKVMLLTPDKGNPVNFFAEEPAGAL